MIKRYLLSLVLLVLMANDLLAQTKMEDTMFTSGKIYTFLTVALVILGGIFFYLIRMDRKLSALEKEVNTK